MINFDLTDKNVISSLLLKENFDDIFAFADEVRKKNVGEIIHLRALLEFSNHCFRRCSYCGLNAENKKVNRFRLSPDEIVETAEISAEAGYKTIVLQSGEDRYYTAEILGDIVKRIKKCGIAVTLSCGELSDEEYEYLYSCGADRYLLKHETSDKEIYSKLHPNSEYQNRIRCLKSLKRIGYETGSGFMIGLPSQTAETIANDLLLLKEIGCDMAGIGPFIPHPDTPLNNIPHGSTELTLRAVSLARIILPKIHLPATTALGVVDINQKNRIFSCGANVIMKKVTPPRYLRDYQIYPSDIEPVDIQKGRKAAEEEISALNRIPL